jgi:DNA-directed RNA polymerase specialized sigma24 family protein
VKPLPGTIHGQSDPFAPTHWSVILAAGRSESEPELARAALAQLCQIYWTPLYTFVRSRGYAMHDAQDLTQSFFAYLIEHKIYARVDREKGKFRSFLLASLKNFLGHAYDREQTLKRGSSLDQIDRELQQTDHSARSSKASMMHGKTVDVTLCFFRRTLRVQTAIMFGCKNLRALPKGQSDYGRLCPRSDFTRLTSADVIAPSTFTSSRKLLAVTGWPT